MGRRSGRVLATWTVVAIAGCTGDQNKQAPALPPPEVIISEVVEREVSDYGEFTGRTSASSSVEVRARVTGYIDKVFFKDGDEVKKDDVLFQIDPRPFQAALENAEGQKQQWEAKLARADADVARYEKLVPTGAATPQDLDKAKADQGEAKAAIRSAAAAIDEAKLNLEFSQVKAPIAGQVSTAFISEGNLVRSDNDLLTTLYSIDPMDVYFNVDEHTMLEVRQRSRAVAPDAPLPDIRAQKVPVLLALVNDKGYPYTGTITFADNKVDSNTGTIRVRGSFDNTKRSFKPGLFARVRVPLGSPFKAKLVIDRAVGTDQSQKFVYVVDDKNVAQYRPVQLGRLEDDGLRVITDGLQSGDWVIVTGLQRARPGKPVTPQKAEMPRVGVRPQPSPAAAAKDASAGKDAPAGKDAAAKTSD